MDWTLVIVGPVVALVGVGCILARSWIADFTADSVRQNATGASLLNRERTERHLIRPYTSDDGRRATRVSAVAWGLFLVAAGVFAFINGLV